MCAGVRTRPLIPLLAALAACKASPTPIDTDPIDVPTDPVVDPDLVVFAEIRGEPIAFGLGLPDFNIALKHAGGELWPALLADAAAD